MPKYYHWLMLIVTVLAAVAAVAALLIQIRARRPELTAQIISAEELTGKHVSGLVVNSSYKGKSVDRLWKIALAVTNTGEKTLIGTGSQTNLVHDRITFCFPDWASILSADPVRRDFDAQISYDGNKLSLQFDQWRSKEQLLLSLDVAAPEDKSETPQLAPESRAIADGDIIIRGIVMGAAKQKQLLIDWLRPAVGIPTKILGIGSNVVLAGMMLIIAVKMGSDFVHLVLWRRKFGAAYRGFIVKEFADNEVSRNLYLGKPGMLPKDKWKNFSGTPFSTQTLTETPKAMFNAFVICFLIGLVILFFSISMAIKV